MPASPGSFAWRRNSGDPLRLRHPPPERDRSGDHRPAGRHPAPGRVQLRRPGTCSSPIPSAGRRRSAGSIRSTTISRWSGRSAAPRQGATSASGPGRITRRLRSGSSGEFGIEAGRPLIGIAPGAAYGPAKKWFPDRFAAVADRLIDATWGAGDPLRQRRRPGKHRRGAEAARHPLIDIAGKTNLKEAIALISRCALFISNDSGLMHVAGALGIPTVAIFGSTNPAHDVARGGEERRHPPRRPVRPLPEAGLPDRFSLHGDDRRGGGLCSRAEAAGRFGIRRFPLKEHQEQCSSILSYGAFRGMT